MQDQRTDENSTDVLHQTRTLLPSTARSVAALQHRWLGKGGQPITPLPAKCIQIHVSKQFVGTGRSVEASDSSEANDSVPCRKDTGSNQELVVSIMLSSQMQPPLNKKLDPWNLSKFPRGDC